MVNKNFKYYFAIWAIFFVVFNAVVFIVTANTGVIVSRKASFWVSYALIIASFVAQLLCAKSAFSGDIKKLFYGLPMIQVSYTGLIVSMIAGAIVISVRVIPDWIATIICLIIAAFEAIAIVKAKAVADIASNRDTEISQKTSFIREMTAEAELLYKSASTEEQKRELKKLYEAFQYSDPVSTSLSSEIEKEMKSKLNNLKEEFSVSTIHLLISLINKRNWVIKGNK